MTEKLLRVTDLVKNYQLGKVTVPALRGVSFDVGAGEVMALIGPSGSGKTTILNMIGALDHPTSGDVRLGDVDISRLDDRAASLMRQNEIGFIFQSFNLIPVMTVFENAAFPLVINERLDVGAHREEYDARVMELLEEVGIAEYRDHKPDELSGGQRQRVAIARALVTRPRLVLADEPTANLDSKTAMAIVDLMERMNEAHQTTFIFSTHDTHLIERVPRRVHMHDGVVEKDERAKT